MVCRFFCLSVCLYALFGKTAGRFCTILFGAGRGSSGKCQKTILFSVITNTHCLLGLAIIKLPSSDRTSALFTDWYYW